MWSETIPYRKYREQYLPRFFPEAAKVMKLTRKDRLLDLCCGTGTLALNFSPFVGSLAGVDMEQPMLDAARTEADKKGTEIKLMCATVEEIPDDFGTFDLVTIGKAHWYLPPAATHARLDKLVAPGGRVLICWATTHDRKSGRWAGAYRHFRQQEYGLERPRIGPKTFMADSSFAHIVSFDCTREHIITVEDVLMRALAYPGSTPEQLGPKKDRYLAKLRAAITPFAVDGKLKETLVTSGAVFARP